MSYAFGHGRGHAQDFVTRSALGLAKVYNLLPKSIVEEAGTVSEFQGMLQDLVKQRASSGHDDWKCLLSPRVAWQRHSLVHMLEDM